MKNDRMSTVDLTSNPPRSTLYFEEQRIQTSLATSFFFQITAISVLTLRTLTITIILSKIK